MKVIRSFTSLGVLLAWALVLSGCQAIKISAYDVVAHQNAILLKAETLALMATSSEPFSQHKPEVDALNLKIELAYQTAAAAPNNQLVAREWQILKDPERDLYGGFVKRWEASGKLSNAFREAVTTQVGEAFDLIICLEAAKKSGGLCTPGGG
jgi:hypothetical protein